MLQILSLPLAEKAGWGAGEVSIFFADFNNGSLQNFSLVHGRAIAGIKSSPAGRFCQFNSEAGAVLSIVMVRDLVAHLLDLAIQIAVLASHFEFKLGEVLRDGLCRLITDPNGQTRFVLARDHCIIPAVGGARVFQ
jgi:hypothetical protein